MLIRIVHQMIEDVIYVSFKSDTVEQHAKSCIEEIVENVYITTWFDANGILLSVYLNIDSPAVITDVTGKRLSEILDIPEQRAMYTLRYIAALLERPAM